MREVVILLITVIFSVALNPIICLGLPTLETGDISPYSEVIYDSTPIIGEVTISPPVPDPEIPTTITAEVYSNYNRTDFSVSSVALLYSIDGMSSWDRIEMLRDNEEDIWQAQIPKQPRGTKVDYYLVVRDEIGNMAIEIPRMVSRWLPNDEEMIAGPIDRNDLDRVLPPDLDILGTWVGYNEDHLYLKLELEGKINVYHIIPLILNAYLISIGDPEADPYGNVLTYPAIVYIPLLDKLNLLSDGAVLLDTNDFESISVQNAKIRVKVHNNMIYLRCRRSDLGSASASEYKICFFTIKAENFFPLKIPTPREATNYVTIYLGGHSYVVN